MTQSDASTATGSILDLELESRNIERSQSEDSSFYGTLRGPQRQRALVLIETGDEDTKAAFTQQLSHFDHEDYWRVHNWNIQVIVARENKSRNTKRKQEDLLSHSSEPKCKGQKGSMGSHIGNKASDETRTSEPFNPYEGQATALQIGESLDDFLYRFRPSNASTCEPWIWCANFQTYYRDTDRRLAEFKQTGTRLLKQFIERRKTLEDSFKPPKHPGVITRMLQSDREQLQSDILKAARDCRITTGKWMLFAPPSRIDRCWADIVRATSDGRREF